MKTLTLTVWLALSTLVGCAVTEPGQLAPGETAEADDLTETASSSPREDSSLQQLLSGQTPATNESCSWASCMTPTQCHHAEGTNIGVGSCPVGTTCCMFF